MNRADNEIGLMRGVDEQVEELVGAFGVMQRY